MSLPPQPKELERKVNAIGFVNRVVDVEPGCPFMFDGHAYEVVEMIRPVMSNVFGTEGEPNLTVLVDDRGLLWVLDAEFAIQASEDGDTVLRAVRRRGTDIELVT